MALKFDKTSFSAMGAIPEALRDVELYPKFAAMMDHIVKRFAEDFEDIKFKYSGPSVVRDEVVKEIITEYGYDYIRSVMETITNFQFNTLLQFISLISLLKGSRAGLELVLKLMGLDSLVLEWWEKSPPGPEETFEIVVVMDPLQVPDILTTLDRIKTFARAYVFPLIENIDFRFNISFGERPVTHAGFWTARYTGSILTRI